MKFTEFLKETQKVKAVDADDLLASIKNGVFTKDGSHLHITGAFLCDNENLTSLVGCPSIVDGDFFCDGNQLTSLVGAPKHVGGIFYCDSNHLTSLAGAPAFVGDSFYCQNNKLTTPNGAPPTINGKFVCYKNKISHLLGLLKIKNLRRVDTGNAALDNVFNKWLPSTGSNEEIFKCQQDLLDAGFEEEAQL